MSLKPVVMSTCRWLLAAAYLLLALTLQPLLLEHAFSAGASHEHSDEDVCAWLDHAASAGVHSSTPPVACLYTATISTPRRRFFLHSITSSIDHVRGPPVFA